MARLKRRAPGMRQGVSSRNRQIQGGRKPGRRPGYFERLRLQMANDRKELSLRSTGKLIAGMRRGESRAGSILRRKKRKRSRLLRKT